MKKMTLSVIAAALLIVGSAGVASAFFHKSLFGGQSETNEAPANATAIADLPVTSAAAAGLVGPGNDGGLGTGLYDFDVILGNLDAPVTITEYASFTCGHCQNFHTTQFQDIVDRLIATGKVKFIYRDFPLDRFAFQISVMNRCLPAEKQALFTKQVYEQQQVWINDPAKDYMKLPREIALTLGVGASEFDACIQNKELQDKLLRARQEAEGLGVNSTPTLFINNRHYRGDRSIGDITRMVNQAN
jgi:protein-disulfide isomerase